MNNQCNNRARIEHAVLTGDYPAGFTFKDLHKVKGAFFLGKPLDYAVGFKNYPPGTTRRDLEPVINTWRKIPRSAWDDLVDEVAPKEKIPPLCAERAAAKIIAVPEVVAVLRPLESRFHAEIMDLVYYRVHLRMGVFDEARVTDQMKKSCAANVQVFLYILQNYPDLANRLLPFRRPRPEALMMVRRRLHEPVVDEPSVKINSQNRCPEAFAAMILQYPELLTALNHKEHKFHRRIWRRVFSTKPLAPETKYALAATGPEAGVALL